MWENETVVLVVSFKKRILAGKDKVRFGRISADNAIPPFIKMLFQKRVEKYLVAESPFSVQPTPHFDLHPEDLENLKGRFLEVLREVASFKEDEVETILREALILRLDYLVKPVDTMRKILFEDQPSISFRNIEEKLEPFSKLLPYAEQLTAECRRLGYKSIEQDEYGSMVSDVVQKITKDNPMKIVLHDFSVTTDFLSETKGEDIVRVEGEILQEFLADRNLWGFRRALDVEMKLGKEDFDAAELEMTLKRYQELKEAFLKNGTPLKPEGKESVVFKELKKETKKPEPEIEVIEPVIEQESETFESLSLIDEKPEEKKPAPKEDTWDLEEVMDRQSPVLDLEDTKERTARPEDKSKTPKSMRIIRREQKNEDLEDEVIPLDKDTFYEKPALPQKRMGLKNLIDEKAEKVFIKKLFDGDATSYEKLLEKLDEAESWRVAKILIDNELFKRDVDPFSREAIKLVDLIYSRYYPEEGIGGGKS